MIISKRAYCKLIYIYIYIYRGIFVICICGPPAVKGLRLNQDCGAQNPMNLENCESANVRMDHKAVIHIHEEKGEWKERTYMYHFD